MADIADFIFKIVCLKYYSPTVTHGKTFILDAKVLDEIFAMCNGW